MQTAIETLLSRLTFGKESIEVKDYSTRGVVETLARVYERARNAMEYRADHLVRRAAIERILRRISVLDRNPKSIADDLLRELRWAKYLSIGELSSLQREKFEKVIQRYTENLDSKVPADWVTKIASAEIEEMFDLNVDFREFTFFAFKAIKEKVKITDENLDLLIYYAVDKVYAESDDEQVAYHILKLGGNEFGPGKLEEAWKLFSLARKHKNLPKITKFVRRQMPPLVLLRDLYFYDPKNFRDVLGNEEEFKKKAHEVLDLQLAQMSKRISTASMRSIIYVFLTKMVLAFGMEVPLEIFIYGKLAKIPLVINTLFPVLLMWAASLSIRLPNDSQKGLLVKRAWTIVSNFESLANERDVLTDQTYDKSLGYLIFSAVYAVVFIAIFGLIFFILSKLKFAFTSQIIFVFFLSIVAFFAFRISQIAKVYLWKGYDEGSYSLFDTISLPILMAGSRLSGGLSKLNFLAFTFDFILEAPFKLILGLLDSWAHFLSIKKDEGIVE